MDEENKNSDPEGQNDEQDTIQEFDGDALRESLAEDLGFDVEEDSERLDKLVEREREKHEELTKAIGQKIKYRDQLKNSKKSDEDDNSDEGKSQPEGNEGADDPVEIAKRTVRQELTEAQIDDLDYPDEVKDAIRETIERGEQSGNRLTVKKALENDYVKYQIERAEKQDRIDGGTPKRRGGGSGGSGDVSIDPSDYDLSTEEGRGAWEKAKAANRKRRQE